MGCCGGGNNKRVKDWDTAGQADQSKGNVNFMLVAIGVIAIGLVIYKYFM